MNLRCSVAFHLILPMYAGFLTMFSTELWDHLLFLVGTAPIASSLRAISRELSPSAYISKTATTKRASSLGTSVFMPSILALS